ncbi:hypothetical protein [Modestobacter sp. Leaf380]|nr:hypothetical protein [Modestobacter sp. Leaf380]
MSAQQPKPEPTPPPREPMKLDPPEVDWFTKNKNPRDIERR